MSDEEKTLVTPPLSGEQIQRQTRMSDDFYTVFSNAFRISVSGTEFRFYIGEHYTTPTGKLEIVEHFNIAVAPAQARAILDVLTQALAAYEKTFGPIGKDVQHPGDLYPASPASPEQPAS